MIQKRLRQLGYFFCLLLIGFGLLIAIGNQGKSQPMERLTARIEIVSSQTVTRTLTIEFKVENHSTEIVEILNPNMGIPSESMNWPYSQETYQTAILISYNYLKLSVKDESGQDLPQQGINSWVTPILLPKLNLAPGNSFSLIIPIGDFYQMKSSKEYQIFVEYGDNDLRVSATADADG